jgi:DNA-binding Lrp family transcriptional regulator
MQTFELDDIDKRLLAAVASFPRAGTATLARKVGVARNTAQARLDRMVDAGVITGFGPDLDLRKVGFGVTAFVSVEIAQGQGPTVDKHLDSIPEVVEAHMTTGPADLLCRVVARDLDHLALLIASILEVPGVTRTTTSVVLTTKITSRERHVIHAD